MAPMTLPPGFRFHPTDEELVAYYLHRKINNRVIELEIIPEVDLYKCEPWDLPDKSFLPSKDMEWYFFSPRDRKYPNGSRTNRATRAGYWKATGKDRPVQSQKRPVGMKKTLVYYKGRAPHGLRTSWVMHEYRLIDSSSSSSPPAISGSKDSYALCRVFKKTIQIPKSKEENVEKEPIMWISEEQLLGDDYDNSGTEISRKPRENDQDENFTNDCINSKFPSDTSSSDLIQGTPTDTGVAEHLQVTIMSDEANSSANMYSLGVDFSSSLIQDMQITNFPNELHYQLPYPPLELDDFPQLNFPETKTSQPETMNDYAIYEKYRDYNHGTLEEIFSLCSSQENSKNTGFSMQED